MIIRHELCGNQKKKMKNTTGFLAEVSLRKRGRSPDLRETRSRAAAPLCREEPVEVDQAFARMPPAHLPREVLEMVTPGCSAAEARSSKQKKKTRMYDVGRCSCMEASRFC